MRWEKAAEGKVFNEQGDKQLNHFSYKLVKCFTKVNKIVFPRVVQTSNK